MNYFETTEYNCKEEVKNRINNLFILHKSKEWTDILENINSIVKICIWNMKGCKKIIIKWNHNFICKYVFYQKNKIQS